MNKRIAFFLFGLVAMLTSASCKKLIEVDPPDDWLESRKVFSNDGQASAAVSGLYSTIMAQTKYFLNGGMSLYPGLSADELNRTMTVSTEEQFATNSLLSINTVIQNNLWKTAYSNLYQCNSIIDGLNQSQSVGKQLNDRLTGEAKFIRALCYYYLVNLFNRVPLILSPSATENAEKPQSSVEVIYSQIIEDLQDALVKLPDTLENTRPNRMACQAFLARVFLVRQDWEQAEQFASIVINSNRYRLVADLNQVFVSNSQETIFQLAPVVSPINTAEGYIFIPVSLTLRPSYVVSSHLLAAFEPGDNRANEWLDTAQRVGLPTIYIFPYKFKVYSSDIFKEYNIVLRFAEQLLIRAEARLRRKNVGGAVEDLNLIRVRAGLSQLSSNVSADECTVALEKERRVELFAEWGHRWIDLKRWGKADEILGPIKGVNWSPNDTLYPIPASEIDKNKGLHQNKGY